MHEIYQYSPRDRVSPSLAVYDCGMENCKPGHSFGPAKRGYYLIHYVVSGRGTYTVGGVTHNLSAGDIFLIRPDEATIYRADKEDPWRYYWVGFLGGEAEGIVAAAGFQDKYVVRYQRDHLLETYMSDMCFLTPSVRARDCAVLGYLYLVFSCLIEKTDAEDAWSRGRRMAEAAAAYIHEHYAEDMGVGTIADALGIDRSYLYRIFKEYMKTSPMEYLMHVRLLNACIALRDTDMCVYEIAYATGFRDLSHFSKMFKKKYRVTPSQYRLCHDTPAILLTDDEK